MGGYAPESINDEKQKKAILKHTKSAYYIYKVGVHAPESSGFSCHFTMLGAYAPEYDARGLY